MDKYPNRHGALNKYEYRMEAVLRTRAIKLFINPAIIKAYHFRYRPEYFLNIAGGQNVAVINPSFRNCWYEVRTVVVKTGDLVLI